MTTHRLKTWPEVYDDMLDKDKDFEVRVNNRDYQVGDHLILAEWNP